MSLKGLKVGDAVALHRNRSLYKTTARRVTKTTVELNYESGNEAGKFSLQSGKEYGFGGSHVWNADSIEPWEARHDERIEEEKRLRRRNNLINLLSTHRWREESDETLNAAYALIKSKEKKAS